MRLATRRVAPPNFWRKDHDHQSPVSINDNLNKTTGKSLLKSFSRWMKISGISRSLYQLDDRTLNDIGICRGDIRAYAIRVVDNDNKTAA